RRRSRAPSQRLLWHRNALRQTPPAVRNAWKQASVPPVSRFVRETADRVTVQAAISFVPFRADPFRPLQSLAVPLPLLLQVHCSKKPLEALAIDGQGLTHLVPNSRYELFDLLLLLWIFGRKPIVVRLVQLVLFFLSG